MILETRCTGTDPLLIFRFAVLQTGAWALKGRSLADVAAFDGVIDFGRLIKADLNLQNGER